MTEMSPMFCPLRGRRIWGGVTELTTGLFTWRESSPADRVTQQTGLPFENQYFIHFFRSHSKAFTARQGNPLSRGSLFTCPRHSKRAIFLDVNGSRWLRGEKTPKNWQEQPHIPRKLLRLVYTSNGSGVVSRVGIGRNF